MKRELGRFADVLGKAYMDQIDRADIYRFMAYYKSFRKAKPRSVYNRTGSIGTFLKRSGVKVNFKFSVESKKGNIPDYVEPAVDWYDSENLKRFFAACDPEEYVLYLFFLHTGARDREVATAYWDDIEFSAQPNVSSIFTIRAKEELDFEPKNKTTRKIPF